MHASALFGPSPLDSGLLNRKIFAPRQQHGGRYAPANPGKSGNEAAEDSDSFAADEDASAPANQTVPGMPWDLFDACEPLSVEESKEAARGAVVFVSRGECEFGRKVRILQDAGAVGVVVVNYDAAGEHLVNMRLNTSKTGDRLPLTSLMDRFESATEVVELQDADASFELLENFVRTTGVQPVRIPSLMITFRDWATIAPCARAANSNVTVSMTAAGEASFDLDYGRDALNWAMMRGMALWILFQCGVSIVRLKRRHSEMTARATAIQNMPVCTFSRPPRVFTRSVPRGSEPLATFDHVGGSGGGAGTAEGGSELDAEVVPTASHAGDDGRRAAAGATVISTGANTDDEDDAPVCAVCLEEFEDGDLLRQLACTHMYHKECIDPWLAQSSACPVCKREIPNLPPPPSLNAYGALNV